MGDTAAATATVPSGSSRNNPSPVRPLRYSGNPVGMPESVQQPIQSSLNASSIAPSFMNQPTLIQKDNVKILILDAPHFDNITFYLQVLCSYGVSDLVRTCEKTYDESFAIAAGMEPHALVFPDGEPPSTEIIQEWLDIVSQAAKRGSAVGVHCLAGLGRAPVLAVVALIENGMRNVDAIELVRSKRRGAINKRQLEYLMSYKRQKKRTRKAVRSERPSSFFAFFGKPRKEVG